MRLPLTLLLFILAVNMYANHVPLLAGRIWNQCNGGNNYTVHIEVLIKGYPSSSDTIFYDLGDGTTVLAPFTSFTRCDTFPDYCAVYYDIPHAFNIGSYVIIFETGNRIGGVGNIQTSADSRFGLYAELVVDPNIGCNSSPVSDSTNLIWNCSSGTMNNLPLSVIDPDIGDSISWFQVMPWNVTAGYQNPSAVGGGTLTVSQSSQQISWNPVTPGLYTLTLLFDEYAQVSPGNYVVAGVTTREILINVDNALGESEHVPPALSFYPNPAANVLSIVTKESCTAEILDMGGRVVMMPELHTGENRIDVSLLAEGVYFLSTPWETCERIVIAR